MKNNSSSEGKGAWLFLLVFTCVFSLLISFASANAAETKDKAPKKGVLVSGFLDNWFVDAQGGVNTVFDNGDWGKPLFAGDITIGKYITPHVGIRAGWSGGLNQFTNHPGWVFGDNKYRVGYTHFDVLFNLRGYDPAKVCIPTLYISAGAIHTGSADRKMQSEAAIGGGARVSFKIYKGLRAVADARALVARSEAWGDNGNVILKVDATVGLEFCFGKTVGFKRPQPEVVIETVKVMQECDHEQQLARLRAQIDSLKNIKKEPAVVEKPVLNGWVTYFLLDKSNLTPRESYHLMDFLKVLPEGATLHLVGHADQETGSKRRNRILSEERVKTVEAALRDLGFQGKITSSPQGDEANPFENPFPKNRCVVIEVTIP